MAFQRIFMHILIQCKDVCTVWSCKRQSFLNVMLLE